MTETKTLDRCNGNYPAQIAEALGQCPDWAESFTLKDTGQSLRVTYSDDPKFGGTIAENLAYIERR